MGILTLCFFGLHSLKPSLGQNRRMREEKAEAETPCKMLQNVQICSEAWLVLI